MILRQATAQVRKGLYDPTRQHDACGVGFIVALDGKPRRRIVQALLSGQTCMEHRGCKGPDNSGDGSGIVIDEPYDFFRKVGLPLGFKFERDEDFAVASIFLPKDDGAAMEARQIMEEALTYIFGPEICFVWRRVPRNTHHCGHRAEQSRPKLYQLLMAKSANFSGNYETYLYEARERAEQEYLKRGLPCYVSSMSSQLLVYRGMLTGPQLEGFTDDLQDPDLTASCGFIHERFSTNTATDWHLSQPFAGTVAVGHNGEFNTLKGNEGYFGALENAVDVAFDGVKPFIKPGLSDSGKFRGILELLMRKAGLTLPEAMFLLMHEMWEKTEKDPVVRGYQRYRSAVMMPWDGPALVVAMADEYIVAKLDKNGLRPARCGLTKDNLLFCASEAGAFPFKNKELKWVGRLGPGEAIVVNRKTGEWWIGRDVLKKLAGQKDYELLNQAILQAPPELQGEFDHEVDRIGENDLSFHQTLTAFGWDHHDLTIGVNALASMGKEINRGMGNNTPMAILSRLPRQLADFFKQRFAQVTNPSVAIFDLERIVSSLTVRLGANLSPFDFGQPVPPALELSSPFLTTATFRWIEESLLPKETLDATWDPHGGHESMDQALSRLCLEASEAIENGASLLIVSDREVSSGRAPIPAALAVGTINEHLIEKGQRLKASIVVLTGEVRNTHLAALLLAYGASAVYPYLMYRCFPTAAAQNHLVKAMENGLLKIMSKVGTSDVRCYIGCKQFDAEGIAQSLIYRSFRGTASKIGGIGLTWIAKTYGRYHSAALRMRYESTVLPMYGIFAYDPGGVALGTAELHAHTPSYVQTLQLAVRYGQEIRPGDQVDLAKFRAYETETEKAGIFSLRDIVELVPAARQLDISEVEELPLIFRRFGTAPMSVGSLYDKVHQDLLIAMYLIGGHAGSGEGGLPASRYLLRPNYGDPRAIEEAIKVQVASGRFGVTALYLSKAKYIEIKIVQGSKPGEGGHLPGAKVNEFIALIRYCEPGTDLLSPSNQHDIYSIEDLRELIFELNLINPTAIKAVKIGMEDGVGAVAVGVVKAGADIVQITGCDGGTGSSPYSSIMNTGGPWELGVKEAHEALVANDLRDLCVLGVDGGLKRSRDVLVACALGAQIFIFGTSPLVALGCTKMDACDRDVCVPGITAQNELLQANYRGKPENVVMFFQGIGHGVQEGLAALGLSSMTELVGQTHFLRVRPDVFEDRDIDLSALLWYPEWTLRKEVLDRRINPLGTVDTDMDDLIAANAGEVLRTGTGEWTTRLLPCQTKHRGIGTHITGRLMREFGPDGFNGKLTVLLEEYAGQALGAWTIEGLKFVLDGMANDGVGKGLCGATIVVRAPKDAGYDPHTSPRIGNFALYGAIRGFLFGDCPAGERFGVRNSGATAVIEGAGLHLAEYMTGGKILCLGSVGYNVGAGMSGGVLYLLDTDGDIDEKLNNEWVMKATLDVNDEEAILQMIRRHIEETGSVFAKDFLADWENNRKRFVKVVSKTKPKPVVELKVVNGLAMAA